MTALQDDYAALQADLTALQDDYAAAQAGLTTLAVLETDYAAVAGIRELDVEIRDLRSSADIKFALAFAAVGRSRQADWDPVRGPGLVATATGRLEEFIEDAQELKAKILVLSKQVPADTRSVYEKSAELYEAKTQEARSLKELVEGTSSQRAIASEALNAYFSCVVVTDDLVSEWTSQLDEAIAHHQAGIAILSEAEESTPELSSKFSEAIAELEILIGQATLLKEDPTPSSSLTTDADDHGDSISEATQAEVPCAIAGVIGNTGDLDYFAFQAEAGTPYSIDTTGGTSGGFYVNLYNSQSQHLNSGQGSIGYTATSSGPLYVLVQVYGGETGPYTLSISVPEDDYGNAISSATAIAAPSSTEGSIEYQGDRDYFSFPAEAGTTYAITGTPGTLGFSYFYLYNSSGQSLASGNLGQEPIVYTPTSSGTLYVQMESYSNETGSYTLALSVPQDDYGNSISGATAVAVPSSTDGSIDYQGDDDYFSFSAEAGTTYAITATAGTLGFSYFYLHNASGQQLASGNLGQQPIAYTATVSGTLYVQMGSYSNNTGSYVLSLSEPEDDHGNSISSATAVGVPSSTDGSVEYVGDRDYLSFSAVSGTAYLIEATPGTLGFSYLYVHNASGQQLASATIGKGQAPLAYTATSSGTLYVQVQGISNYTGTYELSLSIPEDDHGNANSSATAVEAPSSTDGGIEYQGDRDYFSFQTQAGTTYVIAATLGTLGSAYISLPTGSTGLAQPQPSSGASQTYTATTSGTLYIAVQGSGRTGTYTLGIFVFGADG